MVPPLCPHSACNSGRVLGDQAVDFLAAAEIGKQSSFVTRGFAHLEQGVYSWKTY